VLLYSSNVNGGHYLSSKSLNLVGGLMSLVCVLTSGWRSFGSSGIVAGSVLVDGSLWLVSGVRGSCGFGKE